ncbi:MAG: hypothetical protein RIB84_08830 [Sneathiellaceae bacterium]
MGSGTLDGIDHDWVAYLRSQLSVQIEGQPRELVRAYFGAAIETSDSLSDLGLRFALDLRENYRSGRTLGVPDYESWMIDPERFLNLDQRFGNFEDSMVMAVMAARDPASIMSLAAAARLAPRAGTRDLVQQIMHEIAAESRHSEVRHCIDYAEEKSYSSKSVSALTDAVKAQIHDMRADCFRQLKQILRQLLDGELKAVAFVQAFFELSEQSRIKPDVYRSMALTLMRSKNIRPIVKLLLLQNLSRMPGAVRHDIVALVDEWDLSRETIYLKAEMDYVLGHDPILKRSINRGRRGAGEPSERMRRVVELLRQDELPPPSLKPAILPTVGQPSALGAGGTKGDPGRTAPAAGPGERAARPAGPRSSLRGSAKDLLKRDTIKHADLPVTGSFLRGLGRNGSDTVPVAG